MVIPPSFCRLYRRTTFDFQDWRNHRSSLRYIRNLQSLPDSRLIRGVLSPVLGIFAFSMTVAIYK